MKICTPAILVLIVASLLVPAGAFAADGGGVKQPVFLLCPHKEKYSAWSLYVNVDPNDPKKVLSLGLEKLKHKNSKDSSYEEVLAAQKDSSTDRETIATLDAKNFDGGLLEVQKDNALDVGVSKVGDDSYRLMVSLRISADGRFVIGGKEQNKRDVILKYDAAQKAWHACAVTLTDFEGKKAMDKDCKPMSGIVFPVTGTGIYKVVGVIENGDAVVLMDK